MNVYLKNTIARIAVALLIFTPTILLIEHTVKYYLYLLQVLVGLIIYYSINVRCSIKIMINNVIQEIFSIIYHILAVTLPIIYLSVIDGKLQLPSPIKIALVIILLTFVPGWSLINLFKQNIHHIFTNIILSFVIGYILTATLTLILWVLFRINEWYRISLLIYSALAFLTLVKNLTQTRNKNYSFINKLVITHFDLYDSLAMYVIASFFTIGILLVFPDASYVIDTDMSRHYMESMILSRSPELYVAYPYFGFCLFAAMYYNLINEGIYISQAGLVYLNLMQNFAFFFMVRVFCGRKYPHLPRLSTIVWSLFSSFAWLYVLTLKISVGHSLSQEQILWMSYDPTYRSVLHTQGLWFVEYIPFALGIAFMFILIGLAEMDRRKEKSKLSLFLVPIMLALFLTHILPSVLTILILLFYALATNPKIFKRLWLSTIVSIVIVLLIYLISMPYTNFNFHPLYLLALGFMVLISTFAYFIPIKISVKLSPNMRVLYIFQTIIIMVLFISFLFWAISVDKFRVADVYEKGEIPWYFYPFLLGLTGLLALRSVIKLFSLSKWDDVKIFVIASLVTITIGRLITLINYNFFYTFIWEHRIFQMLPAFLAPLAALSILDINTFLHMHLKVDAIRCLVICIIVLLGTTSTLLPMELQSYIVRSPYIKLSSGEDEAMSFLREYLRAHPYTGIIALTIRSYHVLAFAGAPYRFLAGQDLIDIHYEVLETSILPREFRLERILVYMHEDDPMKFTGSIINETNKIFKNQEVSIYELPASPVLLTGLKK